MSIETSTIKRVRVFEEPNGSFAQDGTGTLANFKDLPIIEGTLNMRLGRPTSANIPLQQFIDGYANEELLPMEWELSFEMKLSTFDTPADDGIAAQQGGLGRLLKIAFGAERLGTGDTVNDAGVAATDFDVTTVARWAAGSALGVAAGGPSGGFGVREIEEISSNNLLFKQQFTAAPSNGNDVYNGATYSLGLGGGGAATSAQFVVEGIETQDRWVLLGGQVTQVGYNVGPGIVPRMSFTWRGVYWINGSAAATDLTASALAAATYEDDVVSSLQDSVFAFGTVGTDTSPDSIALPVSAVELNLALQYAEVPTPGGVQNRHQWVRVHQANTPTVSGSFTLPFEDYTYFTARDNRTSHYVFYQIGSVLATRCTLLSVPTVQVTDVQQVDVGGLQYQQVSWKARHDADTTEGTSTALGRSVFRHHMF